MKMNEVNVLLLSLPRRPTKTVKTPKKGLPINSLPGWEHIPLNSKLPMLKCPGNSVIFSMGKIGRQYSRKLKQAFTTLTDGYIKEYNSLHDSHLCNFYANERNLKRLRENGEITSNNDVICTLKDFNEFRQDLHRSLLFNMKNTINEMHQSGIDSEKVAMAEEFARGEGELKHRVHPSMHMEQVLDRKNRWEHAKRRRAERNWERVLRSFERIEYENQTRRSIIATKKVINELRQQKHVLRHNDLIRKFIIKHKKMIQIKEMRLQKNQAKMLQTRIENDRITELELWNRRLKSRIEHEENVARVLRDFTEQKQRFIENHRKLYKSKWRRIQDSIHQRAIKMNLRSFKKFGIPVPYERTKKKPDQTVALLKRLSDISHDAKYEMLLSEDLYGIINRTLELSDPNAPYNDDDPTYKAAQYLMNSVIQKYRKDLSDDALVFKSLRKRMLEFFDDAKRFVFMRAMQILSALQIFFKDKCNEMMRDGGSSEEQCLTFNARNTIFSRRETQFHRTVAFHGSDEIIGTASYAIHPNTSLKNISGRPPTPRSSLTDLIIAAHSSSERKSTSHLDRDDIIFIEHFFTKFKHGVLVGMGQRVFQAIQGSLSQQRNNIRREYFETNMDDYLAKRAARSILRHAIEKIEYNASINLCINAMASDVIWSLQELIWQADARDPVPTTPHNYNQLDRCIYCHGQEHFENYIDEENIDPLNEPFVPQFFCI